LYSRDETARINRAMREWEKEILEPVVKRRPERQEQFSTLSGRKVNRLYTPLDVAGKDYLKDLNFPGGYPFTRGVQPTGYRGQLWTRRQVAGFATPEETNRRLRYLLAEGQTGLNLVCDLPTHHQMDSDEPACEGEVGRDGVPLDTLRDMEVVLEGIDIASISTSLITGGAAVMAMFLALAQKRDTPFNLLRGTLQNDVLSLYYTVNIPCFPLSLSFRLSTDVIEYCVQNLPLWNPISFVGYQIRETGSSSAQEIAFTLASAIAYTKALIQRGLEVDDFAPRFSFFFNAHSDFFEEICKYRAARRLWARIMRERFGAQNPHSWLLRYHVQTAGSSLTAQQPINNVIRTTLQALAAVLGGAHSLHTNSMDEAYSLPSEQAVRTALRIQQVIAYESGVTNTVDPLGGSFFVEKLTDELEEEAVEILNEIESRGGMVKVVEEGWVRGQIEDTAYRYNRELEEGDRLVVGINCCQVEEDEVPLEIFSVDPAHEEHQKRSLEEVRKVRNAREVEEALGAIRREVRGNKNLMPFLLVAAQAYASIGEIREACSV
jgi:methylmalonyl-CoA mutase N-terminal domain/subunit